MSNMVWAMATLGRSRSALLERCAEEALRRGFSRYAPQAISNLVWGFAQLEYCNDAFLTVREESSLQTAPVFGKLPTHCFSGPMPCMHDVPFCPPTVMPATMRHLNHSSLHEASRFDR